MKRRTTSERTGRRIAAVAVVVVLAAIVRCQKPPAPAAGRTLATGEPVVHLLDHLDVATVDAGHAKDVAGDFGAAAAGDRLLADEPHGGDLKGWIDAAQALGGGGRGGGGVRVRFVAAPEEETLLVRARVRGHASLGYLPLREAPPISDDAVAATLKKLSEEAKLNLRRVELPPDQHDWQELSLVARPYPGRKALLVILANGGDGTGSGGSSSNGSGGIDVDTVEVRRLTPAEALAVVPDETVERATHPLRRQIELDLTTVDTLALPAPGRVAWKLRVPAAAPRITFAVGAKLDAGGGTLGLTVAIDGAAFATRALTADATTRVHPFEPWSVNLARFAGREVELALVADGPAESVALFGAPTLLSTAPEPRDDATAPPRNLLLISLDTLRSDAVGCYGGDGSIEVATPNLDRLAAQGTRFARVVTPTCWTLPAHVTLFSGQHPLVHETVKATLPVDPLRTAMLQQRLRANGRATAAFTAGGLVHARYGFGPGFDTYSMKDPAGVVGLHRRIGDAPDRDAAPGEDRMQPVVDWLTARRDVPFLCFVHTYLVHNYRPKAAWMKDGKAPPTLEESNTLRGAALNGDKAAIERMHQIYRWCASEADAEIVGRLLTTLDQLGLATNTLVVVVADHGEEFHEHGLIGHGLDLFGESTRVPWLMRGPEVPRGVVRDEIVTLADVAPTIARRMRLPGDPRVVGVDRTMAASEKSGESGESGGSGDTGDAADAVVLTLREIAGQPDRDALLAGKWKLIRRREKSGNVDQLFDLSKDPNEDADLAANEPERAAQLGRLLEARISQIEQSGAALPRTSGDRRFQMSSELERMLDGLGYGKK
jgi:arylsulfatase A-like enzyme